MEHLIGYTEPQPHSANQTKTALTGNQRGGGSTGVSPTEGGLLMGDNHVLSPILPAYLDSDKQADPPVCSCGAAGMRWHCPPEWDCPENQALRDDPPPVDFDTPAGRSHADRIVLALRYPANPDAVPLASVSKELAGRRWWFVVFDHDVLAGLLRMGWMEGGES